MKLQASVLMASVALIGASVAVAAPPAGKGKPPATGAGCKPNIAVVITGVLAGDGVAAPSALSLNVTGANKFARAYKAATQPLAIQLVATTKIIRNGKHAATDLKSGDRVNIQARSCKIDLANNAIPSLTAVRVVAHPAKA